MKKPSAPKSHRNGLKWRDGRPRWEPSPASRALGLKGLDLRRADGGWCDRGEAISAADARTLWAAYIRDAAREGAAAEDARGELRKALDALEPPQTNEGRWRRQQVQDLIDHARALLDGRDAAQGVKLTGGARTAGRMVEAFLAACDRGEVAIAASTVKQYKSQSKKFVAKFGDTPAPQVTRPKLYSWYHEELIRQHSIGVANVAMGAAGAAFAWASVQDPPWVELSPMRELKMKKAPGRLVFWTMEEEAAFARWCDDNGYEDVADAVVAGLWTGASPVDLCKANLPELQGDVWSYVRQKTQRKGGQAMPGLMPQVKARIARREGQTLQHPEKAFLVDLTTGRRHDSRRSLYTRFVKARTAALAGGEVPQSLADKRLQDCRDTCVTRLWLAGVEIGRIWSWTGHSREESENLLKEHYLVLQAEGQREMAQQLQAWADKQGVAL